MKNRNNIYKKPAEHNLRPGTRPWCHLLAEASEAFEDDIHSNHHLITVSVFAMGWAVARVITAVIFIMAVFGSIPDSDLIREKGRKVVQMAFCCTGAWAYPVDRTQSWTGMRIFFSLPRKLLRSDFRDCTVRTDIQISSAVIGGKSRFT